jgi:hypothetical protein
MQKICGLSLRSLAWTIQSLWSTLIRGIYCRVVPYCKYMYATHLRASVRCLQSNPMSCDQIFTNFTRAQARAMHTIAMMARQYDMDGSLLSFPQSSPHQQNQGNWSRMMLGNSSRLHLQSDSESGVSSIPNFLKYASILTFRISIQLLIHRERVQARPTTMVHTSIYSRMPLKTTFCELKTRRSHVCIIRSRY